MVSHILNIVVLHVEIAFIYSSNIPPKRSLYHEYKNVYKRKLLYEQQRGIATDSTLNNAIHDIEDKLELSSILVAREHAHAEVNNEVVNFKCVYFL